jgi:hypothetical protein
LPTVHLQLEGGKLDRSIRVAIDFRSRKACRQIRGVEGELIGAEATCSFEVVCARSHASKSQAFNASRMTLVPPRRLDLPQQGRKAQ